MSDSLDPLVAEPPAKVALHDAPIVRVIAQLRFPEILSIEQRGFVASFQRNIQSLYPVLRQENILGILRGPAALPSDRVQLAWRFTDNDGLWRVTLTSNFLALETSKYTSRTEYFERLESLLTSFAEKINPSQIDRLGIRYINRITGPGVADIAKLIRPEVRGVSGTLASTHAVHALSETLFEVDSARVLARWGALPPGSTVDPDALEKLEEKSWLIDLDMFTTVSMPFVVKRVIERSQSFAERIYTIFRWAVTDEFLSRYAGKP